MKILVTGAAGFIGYSLAKELLKRGDEVIGLDNISDYYDTSLKFSRLKKLGIEAENVIEHAFINSNLYKKHKFIKMDISNKDSMEQLFKEESFDAVCHLAAQGGVRYSIENPYTYINSNVVGFLHILEGCRQNNIKNLSYASSSSVYGLNRSQPYKVSDTTDHPISLYAATKKSNEMMAHSYSHLYNIATTGLRFFTVYGPFGRPDMAPMLFSKAIMNDKAINVFNHGKMSRDFTYIDDIVEGIIKVIANPAKKDENWNANIPNTDSSSAPYRLYNIGSNSPVSLFEFIEVLENNLEKKAHKNMLPMQEGDVQSTYADVSGLINDFNYQPTTKLNDGVKKFTDWYKEYYGKD